MEILGIITLPGWAVTTLVFMFTIFLYSWYKQSFYTRLGIPQKSTLLLFGDLFTVMRKGFGYIDVDMVKKNGKCFGTYMGCTPSLVISDTEMLKEIMVKQFSKFTDRSSAVVKLERKWYSAITSANGDHWKFLRQTISPTFSSGKIKHMSPYIQRCLDNLMDILEEKRQNQADGFDVNPIFRGFTMDAICGTGFGVEVDSQRNPDNPFIKYAKQFLEVDMAGNPVLLISLLFPDLNALLGRFREVSIASKPAFEFFKTSVEAMITERRKDSTKHRDVLQLLINAHQADEKDEQNGELKNGVHKQRGLNDEELLVNSIIFMIAGYDTTASTLCWLMYELGLNPAVQERLVAKIDTVIGQKKPTYENVFKLEYLEMVVSETLRMHPSTPRLNRQAVEDTEICGIPIKKGMECAVAPLAIHYMPEYWPEPHKFDPERFSPENKANINQFAYSPFGNGPRNCIGQRLALLEIKMTLVTILQKYTVVRSPKLKVPMSYTKGPHTRPQFPVYVKLERRTDDS